MLLDSDRVVNITVHSSAKEKSAQAEVTVHQDGKTVATHKGPTNEPFQFIVSSPKLWSPDSPNLYNVTVKLGEDLVESYIGFRTVSRGMVDGIERPLLNGEFIFMFGTLDQGYWPDGLYTPPSKEAMVYDLEMLKKLGFNMVRKHVSLAVSHIPRFPVLTPWNVDQSRDRSVLSSLRRARSACNPGHAFPAPVAVQEGRKWQLGYYPTGREAAG